MHDESTFLLNSVFWNIEFPEDLFLWVNIDWNDFIDWIPKQYCTNNEFTAQKTVFSTVFIKIKCTLLPLVIFVSFSGNNGRLLLGRKYIKKKSDLGIFWFKVLFA
jgi:hypothetical protein